MNSDRLKRSMQKLKSNKNYEHWKTVCLNLKRRKTVIQAKNYQGTVGNKAIQEVISAKILYKCDIAMVITNSFYTTNAIKTANASGVILVDRNGLEKILSEGSMYFNSFVS